MRSNLDAIAKLISEEDDTFNDHGSMIKLRRFLERRKAMKGKRQAKLNKLLSEVG